ncbi:hypothetical protein Asp14428_10140 [Actinoplanes sp. NBRC 14428]|nr:hypothetical protein Asp14428_10140 [Actinoplanes sp. NBRC 14428]
MPAVPTPARRRLSGTAGATLVVALLVPLGVLARREPPAPGAAAQPGPVAVLHAAAEAAERSAPPVLRPGETRYVAVHRSTLESVPAGRGRTLAVRNDTLTEEWIPADRHDEWLQRVRDAAPPQIWDDRSRTFVDDDPAPVTEWRGRCGSYFARRTQDPCRRPGLWQDPTPQFIATLPADPAELLARLRASAPDGGFRDQEALLGAAQALERDLLPPPVRARMYRALALLPGLTVTGRRAVPHGRPGTALGLDHAGTRAELVIDPANGVYLGRTRSLTAPTTASAPARSPTRPP